MCDYKCMETHISIIGSNLHGYFLCFASYFAKVLDTTLGKVTGITSHTRDGEGKQSCSRLKQTVCTAD